MSFPRQAALLAACMAGSAAVASSAVAGPVLRFELGPERIVCGVTAPATGPAGTSIGKSTSKPGNYALGLIVWFHGGMRSRNPEKGLEAHRPLLSFVESNAYVLASPSAFAGRDWLDPAAVATTEALIDSLLSRYPIDPADISLIGVSDGSLAVIRYGLVGRRTIRRKVLISSLPQLALTPQDLSVRRRLAEGRWDFLQGGKDRLFPAQNAVPFLREWERSYPNAHLHFFADGEHDFGYYANHAPDLLRDLLKPAFPRPNPQKPKKSKPLQNSPKKT